MPRTEENKTFVKLDTEGRVILSDGTVLQTSDELAAFDDLKQVEVNLKCINEACRVVNKC